MRGRAAIRMSDWIKDKENLINEICDYLDELKLQERISGYEILDGVIIKENIRLRMYKYKFQKNIEVEHHFSKDRINSYSLSELWKTEIDHRVFEIWEFIRKQTRIPFK